MPSESPNQRISVCVLAAGKSSRFGSSKLTAQLHRKPLLQHALAAAQVACEGRVYIVVGHDQSAIIRASAGLCDNIVINPDYEKGIGTSIAAGIRAARENTDAILILLADQPLITATHIANIIESWSGTDNEIVASSFDDTFGPPILFPSKAFDKLCDLCGDAGARKILSDSAFVLRSVDFPAARFDVDTPQDLEDLERN